jgi:hypothetical protein
LCFQSEFHAITTAITLAEKESDVIFVEEGDLSYD